MEYQIVVTYGILAIFFPHEKKIITGLLSKAFLVKELKHYNLSEGVPSFPFPIKYTTES